MNMRQRRHANCNKPMAATIARPLAQRFYSERTMAALLGRTVKALRAWEAGAPTPDAVPPHEYREGYGKIYRYVDFAAWCDRATV